MNNNKTVGAFTIIFNTNQEVLLCFRNDKMKWNLPGGQVEQNESPWEAAIRETKEEIGVDIKIDKFIGIYSKSDINDLGLYFIATIDKGIPQISDEAEEIKYFYINDLPKDIILQHMMAIKDYLASNGKVTVKTQIQRLFIEIDGSEQLIK